MPGRIEFLGKHTDYAGGRSLICATEQGFSLTAVPRDEAILRIVDESSGESAELPLRHDLPIPSGQWVAYPATVARRLARDLGPLRVGVDISFTSDLPRDAGLSSSSALVVAVALALADANALRARPVWRELSTPETLAGYLGAVENGKAFGPFSADGGVGTMGGTQDHTAILCAQPGMLSQYGFDPVRFERAVPFPAGHLLVVGVSGVVAAKTREALALYNARAEAAQTLLKIWCDRTGRNDPTLYAALVSGSDALSRLVGFLAGVPDRERLQARLEQFAAECFQIIPAVGDLLAAGGDASGLGPLIDRSQHGAERGLGNQVPETIHLHRSARRLGAVAASAFGAGFGGSVWALVAEGNAERFREAWAADYSVAFPDQAGAARFLTTRPGAPASGR